MVVDDIDARNRWYRKLLYVHYALFYLAWSVEKTVLVIDTFNTTNGDTAKPVILSVLRIILELMLVTGGVVAGLCVDRCGYLPTTVIKTCAKIAFGCTPLAFAVHIADAPIKLIIPVYCIFYVLDGGIKNMRNVLFTQCSPERQRMSTVSIKAACAGGALSIGAGLSMLLFHIDNSKNYVMLHCFSWLFYSSSVATLFLIGDDDCNPPGTKLFKPTAVRLESCNPVQDRNVHQFMLLLFVLGPITHCALAFYEIWAVDEIDFTNVELELSKLVISVASFCTLIAIAYCPWLWPHRKWTYLCCEATCAIAFAVLALVHLSKVGFAVVVALIALCVQVSRVSVTTLFFDYVPMSALTKWSTISLIGSILTRSIEILVGLTIDRLGFKAVASMSALSIVVLSLVGVLVVAHIANDLQPMKTPHIIGR